MTTQPKKYSLGAFVASVLFTALLCPALVLLLSGNWRWLEGWIFSLWFDAMVLSK